MRQTDKNRSGFSLAAIVLTLAPLSSLLAGDASIWDREMELNIEHLDQINRDRARFGLRPVALDPHATEVAELYCEKQLRYGTRGHFTIDGLAPYMRYSLAGGNDGVSENAAAWSADYTFGENMIPELIRRSQEAMLSELPPDDGHRRTLLDPHATHVGIGLAWDKGEFRLVQEFLRRYVSWKEPLPRAAAIGRSVNGSGRAIDGYRVVAASVHHEAPPQTMSVQGVNRITSYGLPKSRRDALPSGRILSFHKSPRGTQLVVRRDGTFSISVGFADGPGVYTIVVWVQQRGADDPIAASNISIRVDAPPTGSLGRFSGR